MKVAVFGAGGYVGRHLMQGLRDAGHQAVAYSSAGQGWIDMASATVAADLTLPTDTDAVIYLAQSPHYRQMPDMAWHLMAVNAVALARVAALAVQAGVPRLIHASTGNVYAPSLLPLAESAPLDRHDWYALSKIHGEECLALLRPRLDSTSVRIFGVFGPEQSGKLVPNLMQRLRDGGSVQLERDPVTGDEDGGRFSLCYISDMVQTLLDLLPVRDCPNLNVAGPDAISIRALATQLAQGLQLPVRFEVAERVKTRNFLADTSLLDQILPGPRMPVAEGIRRLFAETEARRQM